MSLSVVKSAENTSPIARTLRALSQGEQVAAPSIACSYRGADIQAITVPAGRMFNTPGKS